MAEEGQRSLDCEACVLRDAAPAGGGRGCGGPETRRKVPIAAPRTSPTIGSVCLRAQCMGKEEIGQLRGVLPGFEPQ